MHAAALRPIACREVNAVSLLLLLPLLLINAPLVMEAVSASCRLFVTGVMPGLFPYLTLVLWLLPRLRHGSPRVLLLLGWCGGSPTGARLLRGSRLPAPQARFLAVACATMSPMFLAGTVPIWLEAPALGPLLLGSVLAGGWLAGCLANAGLPREENVQLTQPNAVMPAAVSLGQAVESAAQTMLMICGTMALLRTAAELAARYLAAWPALCLSVQTLLEVTCGVTQLAVLPLPLTWRAALVAGATGFGGMAGVLQNRSLLPEGLLTLRRQLLLQMFHGGCSFLIMLGLGEILG